MKNLSRRWSILPHYLLPKRAITRVAFWVANARGGRVTQGIIRRFIALYGVDMNEALESGTHAYNTFNAFFTRALKPAARPLAKADFVCPVDGAISQCGVIEGDQIIQAKGHSYSSLALLGGDAQMSALFEHGHFATLYLSPRDYHRVHMPCDAELRRMVYVPGSLFSVNPGTARAVPGLFARNERVVCAFDSACGPFAMVLVGATIVGSMATVWHGVVNPPKSRTPRSWNYAPGAVALKQGQEMGRFLLGSTVVLLFPRETLQFNADWLAGKTLRMGEVMGHSHVFLANEI